MQSTQTRVQQASYGNCKQQRKLDIPEGIGWVCWMKRYDLKGNEDVVACLLEFQEMEGMIF